MVHVSLLPQSRPLTRSDLDALPDDGHRYELIDGVLIVTPAPSWQHQTIVGEIHVLLHAACPAHLQVLLAPFDVVLALNTVVQPDLLVARRSDLTLRDLPTAPVLAVEVLSPSTRLIDLSLKRARYERSGVPAYWVVDPERPSITAFDLCDGVYAETAAVVGEDTFRPTAPYDLEIVPAQLLGD